MTALSKPFLARCGSSLTGFPNFAAMGGTNVAGSLPLPFGAQFTGLPIADNVHIWPGAIVGVDASGNCIPAGASAVRVVGINDLTDYDNTVTGHGAGYMVLSPRTGVFQVAYSGTTITKVHLGYPVFAVDDNTVSLSSAAGTLPFAGTVIDVSPITGYVYVFIPGTAAPSPVALTQPYQFSALVATSASGALAEAQIGVIVKGGTVASVVYDAFTASTAGAVSETTTATLTAYPPGGGAGLVVATLPMGPTVAFAAHTAQAYTLSGTPANLVIAAGSLLTYKVTTSGYTSGVIPANGVGVWLVPPSVA